MTNEKAIAILEKHLKCMQNNKRCLWDKTHSCMACKYFTTDEEWIDAKAYAIKELQEQKEFCERVKEGAEDNDQRRNCNLD